MFTILVKEPNCSAIIKTGFLAGWHVVASRSCTSTRGTRKQSRIGSKKKETSLWSQTDFEEWWARICQCGEYSFVMEDEHFVLAFPLMFLSVLKTYVMKVYLTQKKSSYTKQRYETQRQMEIHENLLTLNNLSCHTQSVEILWSEDAYWRGSSHDFESIFRAHERSLLTSSLSNPRPKGRQLAGFFFKHSCNCDIYV